MKPKETVIIIGAGDIGKTTMDYLVEKEMQRGVTIITSEPEPFVFKAPKIEMLKYPDKTGQENRRERRKNKSKKQ